MTQFVTEIRAAAILNEVYPGISPSSDDLFDVTGEYHSSIMRNVALG